MNPGAQVIRLDSWKRQKARKARQAARQAANAVAHPKLRVVHLTTSTGIDLWISPERARSLAEALQEARVIPLPRPIVGFDIVGTSQDIHITTGLRSVSLTNSQTARLCIELGAAAHEIESRSANG